MVAESPEVETILFVDDEELVIEPMCTLLETSGYRVISVTSGNQAVEVFEQDGSEIDLVILDVLMPGMDGLETFTQIREIQPKVPVLLASGYSHAPQMDGIKRKGCNGFIRKPYSFSKLLPMVQKILHETNTSSDVNCPSRKEK